MIRYKSIREIDDTSNEGKLLLASLAILTTEKYIHDHPDVVLMKICELSNKMYCSKEELRNEELKDKLNELINKEAI